MFQFRYALTNLPLRHSFGSLASSPSPFVRQFSSFLQSGPPSIHLPTSSTSISPFFKHICASNSTLTNSFSHPLFATHARTFFPPPPQGRNNVQLPGFFAFLFKLSVGIIKTGVYLVVKPIQVILRWIGEKVGLVPPRPPTIFDDARVKQSMAHMGFGQRMMMKAMVNGMQNLVQQQQFAQQSQDSAAALTVPNLLRILNSSLEAKRLLGENIQQAGMMSYSSFSSHVASRQTEQTTKVKFSVRGSFGRIGVADVSAVKGDIQQFLLKMDDGQEADVLQDSSASVDATVVDAAESFETEPESQAPKHASKAQKQKNVIIDV